MWFQPNFSGKVYRSHFATFFFSCLSLTHIYNPVRLGICYPVKEATLGATYNWKQGEGNFWGSAVKERQSEPWLRARTRRAYSKFCL